jgi:hypothetical protein
VVLLVGADAALWLIASIWNVTVLLAVLAVVHLLFVLGVVSRITGFRVRTPDDSIRSHGYSDDRNS